MPNRTKLTGHSLPCRKCGATHVTLVKMSNLDGGYRVCQNQTECRMRQIGRAKK